MPKLRKALGNVENGNPSTTIFCNTHQIDDFIPIPLENGWLRLQFIVIAFLDRSLQSPS